MDPIIQFTEGLSAIIFMNEDVTEVGEDRKICDDAGKADLSFAIVNAKIERMFNGAFDHCARTFFRPISAREKITD